MKEKLEDAENVDNIEEDHSGAPASKVRFHEEHKLPFSMRMNTEENNSLKQSDFGGENNSKAFNKR